MARTSAAPANTNSSPSKASDKLALGTNILSVQIPPELEVKIPTGIKWFDVTTGGDEPGLTPSCVTLLTGMPGGGKTTLALQLADALTSKGATVLYNSGEESRYQVRKVVRRLGLEVGFTFSEDSLVADIVAHGKVLRAQNPGKPLVLILDSLQTLDDGFYPNGHTNSASGVRVVQRLAEFAKEPPFATIIIIGQVTKSGDAAGKNEMRHYLDAHCHIHYDTNKKSETYGMRIFNYKKNRFGPISVLGTVLDIDKNGVHPVDGMSADCDLAE